LHRLSAYVLWDFVIGCRKWVFGVDSLGRQGIAFAARNAGPTMTVGRSPVDRHPSGAVDQRPNDAGTVVLARPVTRGDPPPDQLRSGFYHLALKLDLAVALAYIDYRHKEIGVNRFVQMSGDVERDWICCATSTPTRSAAIPRSEQIAFKIARRRPMRARPAA
jgi:hypothetical protein